MTTELLVWGSLILALALRSIHALLVLPVGVTMVTLLLSRWFPLTPLHDAILQPRRNAHRRVRILVGLVALVVAGSLIHDRNLR